MPVQHIGMGLPLPSGSICFCESFGERSDFAERPAAHLSRKVEAKVISCWRLTGAPWVTKQPFSLTWKK